MMHKALCSIEEVSYYFLRSSINFHRFWPELSVSGLLLQIEYTDGFLNDAQSLTWYRRSTLLFFKVIHQFSRSHRTKKITDFNPNWAFQTVTPVWIYPWFEMMHQVWCSIEEVPYCFPRSSVKFQGHTGWKIDDLNPIWERLLGWSQLSNPAYLPCSIPVCYAHFSIQLSKFTSNLPCCTVVSMSTYFIIWNNCLQIVWPTQWKYFDLIIKIICISYCFFFIKLSKINQIIDLLDICLQEHYI